MQILVSALTCSDGHTYSHDIEETNDNGENAGSHEETPEWHTQRLLARGLLVHVAEHVETEHHHRASQTDEAMAGAEQGPIASEVAAEERALGNNEEHCDLSDVS